MTSSAIDITALLEAESQDGEDARTGRPLPRSLNAEQRVLGAILVDNRSLERVSDFLMAEHFCLPAHQKIFEASVRLIERGQLADPITLQGFFEQDGVLEGVGGESYLWKLAEVSGTLVNVEEYGRIVHDRFLRRALIRVGQKMSAQAFSEDLDVPAMDQIETTEKTLFELATLGEVESRMQPFSKALTSAVQIAEAAYQREGKLSGVPGGLTDVDRKLGGFHNSDLIILAGRPGMGKTALATTFAYNAAEIMSREEGNKNATVAVFSLEMSADQLAARILSTQTQISSHKMRTGTLSEEQFPRLVAGARELERVPLYIDDTPGISVANIRTRCRRLKRERGLGMVVVDYLQLLTRPGRRLDNRTQELSEMTRGLKILAKELDVPVIALSQLNRSVEQREDKRPQLSDLRESGSIEQDADVVMFVYREAYYKEREEPDPTEAEKHQQWEDSMERVRNKAEVIVAKQRHGPTGHEEVYFNGEFTQFGDLEKQDRVPEGL